MDDHFDICCVFKISKFNIAKLTCVCLTLYLLGNFSCFFGICWYINFFEKFFQEYHQNVKQLRPTSGPILCWAWSGSKLFQQRTLVGKELKILFKHACSAIQWDWKSKFWSEPLARIFLLVDLREFFFRFRVGSGGGGWKKMKKLWKWPVNWSFSELFFFFFFYYFHFFFFFF